MYPRTFYWLLRPHLPEVALSGLYLERLTLFYSTIYLRTQHPRRRRLWWPGVSGSERPDLAALLELSGFPGGLLCIQVPSSRVGKL